MNKKTREFVVGNLYLKNGDYKMAEKSFTQHLNMFPEDVEALKHLAQVYEQNKKFDKAFEMYERCYLAEPDRTGVLLDICRILLIGDLWFENVDYRKWYNLAAKAFPSNPIVAAFKDFLSSCNYFKSTLPPYSNAREQEQQQQQQPTYISTTPQATKNSLEMDTLTKILNTLTIVEQRLDKIEKRFDNVEKRFDNIEDKVAKPSFEVVKEMESSKTPAPVTPITFTPPKLNPQPAPATSSVTPSFIPTTTAAATTTSFSLATTTAPFSLATSTTPFSLPTSTTPFKPFTTPPSFLPVTTSTTTATTTTTTASPFSNFASSNTSNLFTDGLKKFNLPNTFSFSSPVTAAAPKEPAKEVETSKNTSIPSFAPLSFTSPNSNPLPSATTTNTAASPFGNFAGSLSDATKPKEPAKDTKNEENEGGNEEDEVVHNEELAIENTCDMTPIVYKTGEEDEDVIFEHRCKLYRFFDKEFKERGLGNIKVLKNRITGKARLIMRREAVNKVCLNCWDCSSITHAKEGHIKFSAVDSSDGPVVAMVFLVRFKLDTVAETFKEHLETLFTEETSYMNNSISSTPGKSNQTSERPAATAAEKSEVELVHPKLVDELVNKARELQLPDLFYHELKNQGPCKGCNGCDDEE